MTEEKARTIANVILLTAGAAAAFVVLRSPPLRRFAFRATRAWLGAGVPFFLANEVRQAWVSAGRTPA